MNSIWTAKLPQSEHPLVLLRPIAGSDLDTWARYLHLPQVYEHTSWYRPPIEELQTHVWRPADNEKAGILRLAIATRATDTLIGTIGLHSVDPTAHHAEVAYDLDPSMWGKGIATSVCRTLAAWALSGLQIKAVRAAVLHTNSRSIKVLENAGFDYKETVHGHRMVRGEPGSFRIYARTV